MVLQNGKPADINDHWSTESLHKGLEVLYKDPAGIPRWRRITNLRDPSRPRWEEVCPKVAATG